MPRQFAIPIVTIALTILMATAVWANSKEEWVQRGVDVIHAEGAHPLYFTGASGQPEGVLADLWARWSERTGIPVRFSIAPWDETLTAIEDGTADIHCGLAMTETRKSIFAFSQPILTIEVVLLARESERRKVDRFLQNEVVGAVKGGYTSLLLRERYPESQVIDYLNAREVLEAFEQGVVNGVVMDLPTFHYNNSQLNSPVDYTQLISLKKFYLHAAVKKGRTDLLSFVEEGLSAISNEERESIRKRWFVQKPAESATPMTSYIIGGALILAAAVYIVFRITRRKTVS